MPHSNSSIQVPIFQIPELRDESFRVISTSDGHPGCSWPGCSWHFHPEVQISYVIQGIGERIIGDGLHTIEAGEVVLLGASVPHVWRFDRPAPGTSVDVLTVHFREDCLGPIFMDRPELRDVRLLLSRACQGLQFVGAARLRLSAMLLELKQLRGLPRLLQLLSILHVMAETRDVLTLASTILHPVAVQLDQQRLQRVCDFVAAHYEEPIDRNAAADIACLSPGAFSRFFRARTGTTFHEYVAEVRIGHACELLLRSRMSITEIAYRCGFEDLRTFNRSFRKRRRSSPHEYRARMLKLTDSAGNFEPESRSC